jgi:hypothetical protein
MALVARLLLRRLLLMEARIVRLQQRLISSLLGNEGEHVTIRSRPLLLLRGPVRGSG